MVPIRKALVGENATFIQPILEPIVEALSGLGFNEHEQVRLLLLALLLLVLLVLLLTLKAAIQAVAAGLSTTRAERSRRSHSPAGPKLQMFWKNLTAAELTTVDDQQVLSLPPGVCFPASTAKLHQLLRRTCYDTAFTKMQDCLASGIQRFLVLGTPGIGKSVFLLDLLHRLACMRRTVVFLSSLTYPSALLFQPAAADGYGGGVFAADNPIEFEEELNDPNTWLLCDSIEFAHVEAITVMASSPRAGAYNRFAKTNHVELWMGPWSLEEIRAARCLEPYRATVDGETVERLYKTWGGIPRYVLETAKNPSMQRKLDNALASSDLPAVLRSVKQIEAAPAASHKLLHVQVDNACEKTRGGVRLGRDRQQCDQEASGGRHGGSAAIPDLVRGRADGCQPAGPAFPGLRVSDARRRGHVLGQGPDCFRKWRRRAA